MEKFIALAFALVFVAGCGMPSTSYLPSTEDADSLGEGDGGKGMGSSSGDGGVDALPSGALDGGGAGDALPAAEDALPPGPDLLGVCPAGMADCDGDPKNGCEAPLNTAWNCGACGSVCKLFGVAVYACIAGTCEVNRCNVGFGNCDGDSKNGCEVNTNLSHDNCGGCGIKCQKFQQCTRIGCE